MKTNLLIIEDNPVIMSGLQENFKNDFKILCAKNFNQAKNILTGKDINIVLLDLRLPPSPKTSKEGFKILNYIRNYYPDIEIIIMTGDEDKKTEMKAIKMRVYDFLHKPIDLYELNIILKRLSNKIQLKQELHNLKSDLLIKEKIDNIIIGESETIKQIKRNILNLINSHIKYNIFITGETGVGKDLIAETITKFGDNKGMPVVNINCASISRELFESELFGHKKGSFTGATQDREGILMAANNGIAILNEITEMPMDVQAKLLDVIENRKLRKVGSNKNIEVDIKFIAITNRKQGEFKKCIRKDLYYRLSQFEIYVPPLREHIEDVPLILNYYLKYYNEKNKTNKIISKDALKQLLDYPWYGNIRELKNSIRRAMSNDRNIIEFEDMGLDAKKFISIEELAQLGAIDNFDWLEKYFKIIFDTDKTRLSNKRVQEIVRNILFKTVYESCEKNITKSCEILKVSKNTFLKWKRENHSHS